MDFFLGAAAASIAICFTNPFDVLKTRMQVLNEHYSNKGGRTPDAYRATGSALRTIVQKEGIRGLYRGLVPAICFQSVGNAFRFGVYDVGKRIAGTSGNGQMSFGVNLLCALIAGISAGIAACPFFIIKTQFQIMTNADSLATGYQHHYEGGMFSAISSIHRRSGFRGFFRGIDAFVPRVAALVSVQLSVYDAAKFFFGRDRAPPGTPPGQRRGYMSPLSGTPLHLVASFIASTAATLVMQPLDLVSSRLMNQPVGPNGIGTYYTGAVDCARKTFEREGMRGFWRGGLANWMRVCPQYMLTFVLVEQFRKLVK